jgi:hypothetical protein
MQGVDYPPTPAAVQVIGFLADGSTAAIQFNIPQMTAFHTFTLADADGGDAFAAMNFTEIAIVGFRCDAQGACSGLDGGNGQIGLDNISLSDVRQGNDVPEPATASLLAAAPDTTSSGRLRGLARRPPVALLSSSVPMR